MVDTGRAGLEPRIAAPRRLRIYAALVGAMVYALNRADSDRDARVSATSRALASTSSRRSPGRPTRTRTATSSPAAGRSDRRRPRRRSRRAPDAPREAGRCRARPLCRCEVGGRRSGTCSRLAPHELGKRQSSAAPFPSTSVSRQSLTIWLATNRPRDGVRLADDPQARKPLRRGRLQRGCQKTHDTPRVHKDASMTVTHHDCFGPSGRAERTIASATSRLRTWRVAGRSSCSARDLDSRYGVARCRWSRSRWIGVGSELWRGEREETMLV